MQIKSVNKTFRTQWFYGSADYKEGAAREWKRQVFTKPSRNQTIRVDLRLNSPDIAHSIDRPTHRAKSVKNWRRNFYKFAIF